MYVLPRKLITKLKESSSCLVYATTHSNVVMLDLRTMIVMQTMENPRHYGPITSLCIDRKRAWIVVGTSTGVLTLWDKRFGLLIRSWHVGIAAGGRSNRIHQCVVHPSSKGRGKWVMVALEASKKNADRSSTHLIEVWDIEKATLVETYVTRTGSSADPAPEPPEVLGQEAEMTAASAIAALVRSRQNKTDLGDTIRLSNREELPQPPSPDIRAMAVGSEFGVYTMTQRPDFGDLESSSRLSGRGFIVTGSEDTKIRLWDLGKFEQTTVLSGLDNDHEKPSYRFVFSAHMHISSSDPVSSTSTTTNGIATFIETWPRLPSSSSLNRPSQRISLITQSQQQLLKNHQDVITTLVCIESPFRGGIVSGDRAGVIKVWRVEQVDHRS